MSAWYALTVRSRHEKSVFAQLDAKEHTVFLPLYNRRTKWVDRWQTVQVPLFPGYVFCHFDAGERSKVIATSGVIDVVRFGADLAAIDPAQIEAVRRVVDSRLNTAPHEGLVAGDRVRIGEGPLIGLTGTLLDGRKNPRFAISVELLRRSVIVEVDREWVLPLSDDWASSSRSQLHNPASSLVWQAGKRNTNVA
jgi:transcription antitermination factor NusG